MNALKSIILFLFLIFGYMYSTYCQTVNEFKLKTVVLDPGHGGNDPGAVYAGYKEKDITLNVALALGEMITKNFSDVKVIYTRKTDVAVDLTKRGQIANNAKADLFISIHVNAASASSARGTETFVMGYDQSSRNLDVAMRENNVITFEEDYKTKYEGFDPNSAESYIIFSLMQYSFLEQSLSFASNIQQRYQSLSCPNRGVKQAAFLVLWRTTMPSVLTEIGFLSNAEDRKLLTTKTGQSNIAKAIFNAFVEYKEDAESSSTRITASVPENISQPTGNKTMQASTKTPASKSDINKTDNSVSENTQSQSQPSKGFSTLSGANIENEEDLPQRASASVNNTDKPVKTTAPPSEIIYRVQVKSASKKLSRSSANFGKYKNEVKELYIEKRYKYFLGETKTYKEALSLQKDLKNYIFKDAFLTAFKNGKQISIQEALKQTKQ